MCMSEMLQSLGRFHALCLGTTILAADVGEEAILYFSSDYAII